jgi:hypothetical protein
MFGLPSRFGCVIGPPDEQWPTNGLRQVDIYAAGKWITCDDSNAYVPHFANLLMATVHGLLANDRAERYRRPDPSASAADNHRRLCAAAAAGDDAQHRACRFMDWGPTTDNVHAHLFLEDGMAIIPFSFWRDHHHDPTELGQVFVAELPEPELIRLLHKTAWTLAFGG